jgi:UrcA family protein
MYNTLRTKLHFALCCAVAASALCGMTAPARADAEAIPAKTVRFDDLDITKPAGAQILYHRIQAAAQQVCEGYSSRDLARMAVERTCVDRAIDAAVRHVNAAALTELRFGSALHLAGK